jgi:hypothetical protein
MGAKVAANCSILAHSGVWLFIALPGFSDYTAMLPDFLVPCYVYASTLDAQYYGEI